MKHAKDMRRELEKQITGLKEEVDQLRNKSKQDAIQMQSLQDDLIGLEKVKANKEFEYKQLMQKFEQEKSDFKVSVYSFPLWYWVKNCNGLLHVQSEPNIYILPLENQPIKVLRLI